MLQPQVNFSPDISSSDIQEKIHALAAQVKAQPDNEVALLQLAHLYAQVWIKNPLPEIIQRVLACLDRAVQIDKGQYVRQIRQVLDGIGQHIEALRGQMPAETWDSVQTRLADLAAHLDAKSLPHAPEAPPPVAQPAPQSVPEPTVQASPVPQSVPEPPSPSAQPVSTPSPPSVPLETEVFIDEPLSRDELPTVSPEIGTPDWMMNYAESNTFSGMTSSGPGDIDMEIETVGPESGLAEGEPDRADFAHEMAASSAASLLKIQQMFENEQLDELLRSYSMAVDVRVKRRIIEGLIERIGDWNIEPVLAVGALESNEQVFRYIMRALLKHDRTDVCRQIDIANYSPDLQKVAVIVLSELGVRSALPKLEQALKLNDPIVRTVAAHGIARAGKAGISHIPKLLDAVRSDPNVDVRHAAAKALSLMNVKEAYEALEAESSKTRFDAEIYANLESLRERFGEGAEKKRKVRRPGAADAGLSEEAKKNLIKMLVLIVIVVIAGYFAWGRIKDTMIRYKMWPTQNEAPRSDF